MKRSELASIHQSHADLEWIQIQIDALPVEPFFDADEERETRSRLRTLVERKNAILGRSPRA